MLLRTIVFALCVGSLSAFAKPAIRFEQRAVVATQVREGATVVWLGFTHAARPHYVRTVEYALPVADLDRDGVVRLDVPEGISPGSVWIAIDLTTGEFDIGSPGNRMKRRQFGAGLVHNPGNGAAARFLHSGESITTYCFVRPGVGAWVEVAEDGVATDADRSQNGSVAISLASMTAIVGAAAPPTDVRRDDLLVAISPESGAVYDIRFAQ